MTDNVEVLVTFDLPPKALARIQEVSERIHVTAVPVPKAADLPAKYWKKVEVLYTGGFLPNPDLAPNLRWVQFATAGVDPHIDHPLLHGPDVVATTMSGVITSQIAEYVLMALLAFGQRLPLLYKYQHQHYWPAEDVKRDALLPIELRHSTVGILGYGSIGRQVARLCQSFGATVLAVKKDVMHPEDRGYIQDGMGDPHGDFFHRLYPVEAFKQMLKLCDFLVVALPLTEETYHILDAHAFEVMKESAYLVNVGRGELIDQTALVEALRNHQIAGAALDVFEEEPLPEESPLWELENVILSPHISWLSAHLQQEMLNLFLENLNRYLARLPLYNIIDPEQGY